MHAGEREQIDRIIRFETESSLSRANKELNELCAKRAIQGINGPMLRFAARDQMAFNAGEWIDRVSQKAIQSAKGDPSVEIRQGFANLATQLRDGEFKRAVAIGSGDASREPQGRLWEKAQDEFAERFALLNEKLEIALYQFVANADAKKVDEPSSKSQKNIGGKPIAEHWDAMWADIAVKLWIGDLKPKRQAEISKAMHEWLSNQGIEAGNTAVTDRARALWQRIENLEQ